MSVTEQVLGWTAVGLILVVELISFKVMLKLDLHCILTAAVLDGGHHLTVQSVEERMRKLVERCDRFGGTVLMHSLAGGTGAGE